MSRTGSICVASYNVHRCLGVDGRYDVGRVRQAILELDADIIGLQEVATGHGASPASQLAGLAHKTGYKVIAGPLFHRSGSHFGNALLSRLQVCSCRSIDLSMPGREPRGAIDAWITTPVSGLRVLCTHLGLGRLERAFQMERIITALGKPRPEPLVLLGDLNEWLPRRELSRALSDHFGKTPWVRTFPSRLPLLGLDRIYAGGRSEVRSLRAVRTPLTRVASDHLPVLAEIILEASLEERPGASLER